MRAGDGPPGHGGAGRARRGRGPGRLLESLNRALGDRRERRSRQRTERGSAMDATPRAGSRPRWRRSRRSGVVDLDVREDLRDGTGALQPHHGGEAGALPRATCCALRATFEPVPLYHVLGKQGFAHWTERARRRRLAGLVPPPAEAEEPGTAPAGAGARRWRRRRGGRRGGAGRPRAGAAGADGPHPGRAGDASARRHAGADQRAGAAVPASPSWRTGASSTRCASRAEELVRVFIRPALKDTGLERRSSMSRYRTRADAARRPRRSRRGRSTPPSSRPSTRWSRGSRSSWSTTTTPSRSATSSRPSAPGAFGWEYLEQGPAAWRVRIGKA